MEVIMELFLEFLIQLVGEVLVELGVRALAEPFRKPANAWIAAIGYAAFGSLLGAISLCPLPQHMVVHPVLRVVNLIATPLAVGLCMMWLGAWRSRRGQLVLRIDRFWCGTLFAISFAFVRFVWAT